MKRILLVALSATLSTGLHASVETSGALLYNNSVQLAYIKGVIIQNDTTWVGKRVYKDDNGVCSEVTQRVDIEDHASALEGYHGAAALPKVLEIGKPETVVRFVDCANYEVGTITLGSPD